MVSDGQRATCDGIGILTSAVSAFYYLRIVKVMYFDQQEAPFDARPPALTLVAGISAAFTTLFIIFPAPIVAAASSAAKVIFG